MSTSLAAQKSGGCPSGPWIRFLFLSISKDSGVVFVVDAIGRQKRRSRPCGVVFGEVGAAGLWRIVRRRRVLVSHGPVGRRHTSPTYTASPLPHRRINAIYVNASITPFGFVSAIESTVVIQRAQYCTAPWTITPLYCCCCCSWRYRPAPRTDVQSPYIVHSRPECRHRVETVAVKPANDPSIIGGD